MAMRPPAGGQPSAPTVGVNRRVFGGKCNVSAYLVETLARPKGRNQNWRRLDVPWTNAAAMPRGRAVLLTRDSSHESLAQKNNDLRVSPRLCIMSVKHSPDG